MSKRSQGTFSSASSYTTIKIACLGTVLVIVCVELSN